MKRLILNNFSLKVFFPRSLYDIQLQPRLRSFSDLG